MLELAFATYRGSPEMTADDRLVADALRRDGIEVSSAAWDARDVDWSRFDSVVIRSTWDYHLAPDRYVRWLRSFSESTTRLWNPPEAVVRNMNKGYLSALARRGVGVVLTTYLTAPEGPVLRDVLEDRGWDAAVIKPAVSASARGTWRTSLATAEVDQTTFAQDLLVQPFLPEVASQGSGPSSSSGGGTATRP
jgi:glutathione synthase/RimK-type ligase-like ATP-grasp enzyme